MISKSVITVYNDEHIKVDSSASVDCSFDGENSVEYRNSQDMRFEKETVGYESIPTVKFTNAHRYWTCKKKDGTALVEDQSDNDIYDTVTFRTKEEIESAIKVLIESLKYFKG